MILLDPMTNLRCHQFSKCQDAQISQRLKQFRMLLHNNKPNPHLLLEVHKGLVCSDQCKAARRSEPYCSWGGTKRLFSFQQYKHLCRGSDPERVCSFAFKYRLMTSNGFHPQLASWSENPSMQDVLHISTTRSKNDEHFNININFNTTFQLAKEKNSKHRLEE